MVMLAMLMFLISACNLPTSSSDAKEQFSLCTRSRVSDTVVANLSDEAYNALMDMDYKRARQIYEEIISGTDNEFERLEACIGMMRLCYRVSANREFYDYRTNAERSMQRIKNEKVFSDSAIVERLGLLQLEYNIVSANYFAAMGLYEEYSAAAQMVCDFPETADTSTMLDVGLVKASIREKSLNERFTILYRGIMQSSAEDCKWHSGHYKLMLAMMLRDAGVLDSLQTVTPGRLARINKDSVATDELPQWLAEQSVDDFRLSGDRYMVIKALAVLASCHIYHGDYYEALDVSQNAIDEVNRYFSDYYAGVDTLPPYTLFQSEDSLELKRMAIADVVNIPECMLLIRNEVSCAYAALGDKDASDANRNSYLDLLHVTRQNSEIESRAHNVARSATIMLRWVIALALLLVAVVLLAMIMLRRWRRNNKNFTSSLMAMLQLCRELTAFPLSCEFSDNEEVDEKLTELLQASLTTILRNINRVSVVEKNDARQDVETVLFVLSDDSFLKIYTHRRLTDDEKAIIDFLLPYISVARSDAARLVAMGDERLRLEELNLSYAISLTEHKRENILKRASLSVVVGMRPYMDRMSKTLTQLSASGMVEGDDYTRKLNYVAELTDKLNEYNTILERWIKMRRGELSLNIETFSLQELFDIIAKGSQAFSMRGLALEISPCDLWVKADKALTLFMINTLVDNAAKFTPAGGVVELAAIEVDGAVEVAVSDSGVGLSDEDIRMILGEKVYDAAVIGSSSGEDVKKNKGGGFGLMNCKGIIEKYKKTDTFFSVCRMDIESRQGGGSRFSFRLPRGIVHLLLILFMFVPSKSIAGLHLERVVALTDSIYISNVHGDYNVALDYAQRVVGELNAYYKSRGGQGDTLRLNGVGEAAETAWWREGFATDTLIEEVYYNMLDVRNEVSVAMLALQRWDDYRYNNNAYTSLHRLVHEDKRLATYYSDMQKVVNARRVTIALSAALLLLLAVALLLYYFRQNVMNRINLYSALEVNRCLLKAVDGKRLDAKYLVAIFANELNDRLEEMMRVEAVCVAFKDAISKQLVVSKTDDERLAFSVEKSFLSSEIYTSADGGVIALPLVISVAEGTTCVGAFAIKTDHKVSVNEKLMLEIVAGYIASLGYHATVEMAREYRSFDELVEESNRMKYEENVLHVQNQVLDNCMSMIKHETIYYPSRIRKLVADLMDGGCDDETRAQRVAAMCELMEYYTSMYGVLTTCAMNQLGDVVLMPSRFMFGDVAADCSAYVKRRTKRSGHAMQLLCEDVDTIVYGDKELIAFLLESIFMELTDVPLSGNFRLSVKKEQEAAVVEILDTRRHLDRELRELMFVPSALNIPDENGAVVGVGFLIAKEIVRMHEDYMGRYGGRMEAVDTAEGTLIRFTLPDSY